MKETFEHASPASENTIETSSSWNTVTADRIPLGRYNLTIDSSIELPSDPNDVFTVTDQALPIETVKRIEDPNQICLVHSTDFFPQNGKI